MKTKSRLFKIAHSIKSNFFDFAAALRHAWKIIKLIAKMKKQNVSFVYRKVSGEIRGATGTLNIDYDRKTDKELNPGAIVYFDVDANGFRSFKAENLIY